jgi:hypothetical protein
METIDSDRWVRIYAHLRWSRCFLASDFIATEPADLVYAILRARRHLDRILDELDT